MIVEIFVEERLRNEWKIITQACWRKDQWSCETEEDQKDRKKDVNYSSFHNYLNIGHDFQTSKTEV